MFREKRKAKYRGLYLNRNDEPISDETDKPLVNEVYNIYMGVVFRFNIEVMAATIVKSAQDSIVRSYRVIYRILKRKCFPILDSKKASISAGLSTLNDGGASRSRTEVHGFAIRC
ncbi:hypothetical protein AB6D66_26725, partial [Vibrio pomeroyi]